jgi:Uma2 family endonuclease
MTHASAATPTPMTAEQLLALPTRDGNRDRRYELVRGRLRVMEPPGGAHGWLAVRLAARLLAFVEPRALGDVFTETGFVLARGPDTVRGPDVSFVRAGRLPVGDLPAGYLELAPDLAVEIRSPTDRRGGIEEKLGDYFAAGTPLVWLVDPARRTVAVRTPDGDDQIVREGDTLDGGEVLPGFTLTLADLFARRAP